MIGDTASRWLLCCLFFLVLSPIILLAEVAIAVGHFLKANLMDEMYQDS